MTADFLYFFCSSCARFLSGSDTPALRVSFIGQGPAAVAAERRAPVCCPGVSLLPSGLCQHLGLQWRAPPPLLCSLLCATRDCALAGDLLGMSVSTP